VPLICLPYAVFGSVIWAAHHQFGQHSLLDRAPLVVADRTPLKLRPTLPRDRSAPEGGVGGAERRLVSAGSQQALASSDQAGRPELAALQFGMRARVGSLSARLAKGSIAGPEQTPGDAPADITQAALAEAREPATASRTPPKPSFKPIAAIPAVAATAAPDREAAVVAEVEIATVPPPRPALKPIVMPAREFDPRLHAQNAVAGADDNLPHALRAWWTDFKILLASGPAEAAHHAGGGDSDREAAQRSSSAREGGADDRGGGSGGGNGPGGNDGARGGGSTGAGDDRDNDAGGGSSAGGSRSGGTAGDGGRGIGGRVGDSSGSIADGIGRGIGDSVGRGSSTSRGDGDRGGRGGGRGARGDDRGGRDADRGGRDGRGRDGGNGRGDRGDRDGGGRGGNDRGDRDR
jgi:hypothetical protein